MNWRIVIITLGFVGANLIFPFLPFASSRGRDRAIGMAFGQIILGLYLAIMIE